jgi:hypothetical protein
VLPLTRTSYTPIAQFARSSSTPIPTAPLGSLAAADSAGDAAIYVGDATDLFILTSASNPNFANASSAAGAYATPTGNAWNFDTFAGSVYATNGSNPIQSAPIANAAVTFSTVDANAPIAKCIAAIQPGFLLCGNIVDVTVGTLPQGVRWSVLGAAGAGSWPLVGSIAAIAGSSDAQDVKGNNGPLRSIAANLATCNAALFFDKAVYAMTFTGDSKIFSILPVDKLLGTPAGGSVVVHGQTAYYLGHDGYRTFDGTSSASIGAGKVNAFFFKDADPNFISQVQGTVDPTTGLIYWAYSSSGASGVPNRILVYHPIFQRFTYLVPSSGISNVLIGLTIGIALDNITTQTGFSLDAIPYSLDSAILSGGNLVLGGFDASFHFGFFTGPNDQFSVETTESQFNEGLKSRIRGVRPIVEGDIVSAAVGVRTTLNATSVYAAASAPNRDGICMARSEGRYQRIMLTGAIGNTVQHVKGAQVILTPGGSR